MQCSRRWMSVSCEQREKKRYMNARGNYCVIHTNPLTKLALRDGSVTRLGASGRAE